MPITASANRAGPMRCSPTPASMRRRWNISSSPQDRDGWTLLRMARARKKLAHIPIVFLTALSDDMSRLQGYRMGVDDYLPKTLPPDEIIARIQGVLARRKARKAAEAQKEEKNEEDSNKKES